MDRPCKYGKNLVEQEKCGKFSNEPRADGQKLCYFYRSLNGEHWCNGMYENTQEKEKKK